MALFMIYSSSVMRGWSGVRPDVLFSADKEIHITLFQEYILNSSWGIDIKTPGELREVIRLKFMLKKHHFI